MTQPEGKNIVNQCPFYGRNIGIPFSSSVFCVLLKEVRILIIPDRVEHVTIILKLGKKRQWDKERPLVDKMYWDKQYTTQRFTA